MTQMGSSCFYVGDEANNQSIIEFENQDDDIVVTHTYVTNSLLGQGIAKALVLKAIEYARQYQKKIIRLCSYFKKELSRNSEYADVLKVK